MAPCARRAATPRARPPTLPPLPPLKPRRAAQPARRARQSRRAARPRRPLPGLSQLGALLRDRRFHLLIGFGLLLGSLYLTIAFTSFLLSGRADQSVVAALGNVPVKEAGQETGNWLGLLGAWLAEKLIYRGFGLASYALIPMVFFLGYKIVFRRAAGSVSYWLALGLFSMLWVSTLLGYVVVQQAQPGPDPTPTQAHRLDWLSGGAGYELALWLDSLIGWGTVLLLAFGLIMFVVFFFNVTNLNLNLGGADEEDEEVAEATAPAAANRPTQPQAASPTPPREPEPAPEFEPEFEPAPQLSANLNPSAKHPAPSTNLEITNADELPEELEPAPVQAAASASTPASSGPAFSFELPAAEPEMALAPAVAASIPTPSRWPTSPIVLFNQEPGTRNSLALSNQQLGTRNWK
ncbi:MAG: DNA translocase FtsK 4TM domain-containing protein [Hymenobacter sp.]